MRRSTSESRDALVEIVVQIPLLLAHRLLFVLELLDAAPELPDIGLHLVQVLGQLDQALVGNDALDPSHPRIEIVELHLHRVVFSRGARTAPGGQGCDAHENG